MRKLHRAVAILLVACLAVPSAGLPVSAQSGTTTCMSDNQRYNYCRVDTNNSVRLVRQISISSCDQGRSWGYDARGVWVDRGCSAEFEVGGSGGGGGHAGRNTAIAAGILGALIVGAAVASHKSGTRDDGGGGDPQRKQYYDDGYRLGQKDHDEGGAANAGFGAASRKVPSQLKRLDEGYDDGYNNRRRRYNVPR